MHYCYHPESGVCCSSLGETKDKLKQAYCNLFLSHAFPEGTLSRWTHVRTVLSILIASEVFRGVFFKALLPVLAKDTGSNNDDGNRLLVAFAGAGDADMQATHGARKRKVVEFMSRPSL